MYTALYSCVGNEQFELNNFWYIFSLGTDLEGKLNNKYRYTMYRYSTLFFCFLIEGLTSPCIICQQRPY